MVLRSLTRFFRHKKVSIIVAVVVVDVLCLLIIIHTIFAPRGSRLIDISFTQSQTADSSPQKDDDTFRKEGENIFSTYSVAGHIAKMRKKFSEMVIEPIDGNAATPLDMISKYDKFLNAEDASPFQNLPLEDRCKFYFRELYELDETWSNDVDNTLFMIRDSQEEHNAKKNHPHDSEFYRRQHNFALNLERLRLYNKCFLKGEAKSLSTKILFDNDLSKGEITLYQALTGNENLSQKYKKSNQYEFEQKMFPFLKPYTAQTFKELIPTFTRGDENYLPQGYLPMYDDNNKYTGKLHEYQYDENMSFWQNWNNMRSKVSKRGIILCPSDNHIHMILKLIATLRYQQNKLPIQFVFKEGELSKENMKILMEVATGPKVQMPGENYKDVELTVQDVWFVDISNVINPKWKDHFATFKNKWLSTLFNLFEEYVFIDSDSISYVDMNHYFEMDEYKKTGTVFFLDRILDQKLPNKCVPVLNTLFPSALESKHFQSYPYMDSEKIKNSCENTLSMEEIIYQRYFEKELKHQMEAGLLAIDNKRHIMPLIVGTLFHFTRLVGSCSHGDKEHFWLGFLFAGEEYAFVPTDVGTMGELVEKIDKPNHKRVKICNIQITHYARDSKTLWINGGTSNAKRYGQGKGDWSNPLYQNYIKNFKNVEELEKYYYFTPIESDFAMITKSWVKTENYGRGITICANVESKLSPFSYTEMNSVGEVFEIPEDEKENIKNVNYVWALFDVRNYIDIKI